MRRRFAKTQGRSDIDMTPMLDIVFIMLIFFIVTATFFDKKGIFLTQSQGHGDAKPGKTIQVYLYANGRASVDGRQSPLSAVPLRVQSIRAEFPQASVHIGADAGARLGDLITLKDKFSMANIPTTLKVNTEIKP